MRLVTSWVLLVKTRQWNFNYQIRFNIVKIIGLKMQWRPLFYNTYLYKSTYWQKFIIQFASIKFTKSLWQEILCMRIKCLNLVNVNENWWQGIVWTRKHHRYSSQSMKELYINSKSAIWNSLVMLTNHQ